MANKIPRPAYICTLFLLHYTSDGDGSVRIHAGGDEYPWGITLTEAEQRLDPELFVRIHRSYLVNRLHIRQVKALTRGEYALTLADGTMLDSSRRHRHVIEALVRGA